MILEHPEFFSFLRTTDLSDLACDLRTYVGDFYGRISHGDLDRWLAALESLPSLTPSGVITDSDAIVVVGSEDIGDTDRAILKDSLMLLHPWRKGPFDIFGVHIDSEWRCDLKWNRLKDRVDLKDKLVLDVGCGNGYYMYRMLGAAAKAVVGIDPTLLYVVQFAAINKYIKTNRASVLPLRLEDMPRCEGVFDTVFSMGILYHRREPKEHISELLEYLKPEGRLVLETIILDRPGKDNLVPDGRYAKMRNVWNIPTVELLCDWLKDSGGKNIDVVAVAKTTETEQRKTEWMAFESLGDYLDPDDSGKTIEGYPAPSRAMIIADK